MVVAGFFIFQQITGINVPLYYGPHLLGPIFQGSTPRWSRRPSPASR